MDMNWIDEIRDPEPRKRYIYNADDYDPQYGDPYYREHSTRADSLWRLYEESGTSITFDAFADESRQTDYRMETGALRDFFNGSQSALSSYRNPMGGNPLIAFGSIGRWDGERTGISSFETFDDLMNGDTRVRMPAHRMGHRCQGEGLRRTHGRRIYEPVRAGHDRHQGR